MVSPQSGREGPLGPLPPGCSCVLRDLIPLERRRLVGERVGVGHAARVHTVTELVVRAQVRQPERSVEERAVALADSSQVDVDDVVLEPAPVREAAQVAVEDAEPVRRAEAGRADRGTRR